MIHKSKRTRNYTPPSAPPRVDNYGMRNVNYFEVDHIEAGEYRGQQFTGGVSQGPPQNSAGSLTRMPREVSEDFISSRNGDRANPAFKNTPNAVELPSAPPSGVQFGLSQIIQSIAAHIAKTKPAKQPPPEKTGTPKKMEQQPVVNVIHSHYMGVS